MPRIILATLLLLTTPLAVLAGPYDVPSTIPDTGQTQCYDTEHNEIPCAGTGQDGEYSINPMSYTKLDGEGNELPDSAESWVMVRDNVTGLIWEVKTNKDGVANYDDPHDADNEYTWYDPDPATNGGGDAGTESEHDTLDFIEELNNANYGGHSDWRLPSREELRSIVDYGIPSPRPTVDVSYFPNSGSSHYWSSTTSASNTNYARSVSFGYGYDNSPGKSVSLYVRAVRGGQGGSFGSWIIHENDTATHEATGLMWQTNEAGAMTWQEALAVLRKPRS